MYCSFYIYNYKDTFQKSMVHPTDWIEEVDVVKVTSGIEALF